MTRYVWPRTMQLYIAERPELARNETWNHMAKKIFQRDLATPVVLRWSTWPGLGFPARPFQVWRRPRRNYPTETLGAKIRVSGSSAVEWGLRPMYLLGVRVTPDAGTSATITALDSRRMPIPGQVQSVSAATTVVFRANGIAAARVAGDATIDLVIGVPAQALASSDGWTRFDVVGLPYRKGDIDPGAYDAVPQGPEPPSMDGYDAALQRLLLAWAAHLPPGPLPAADLPALDWPAPDFRAFIEWIHDKEVLTLITKCLTSTNNAALGNRHINYLADLQLPGLRQVDQPGGGTADGKSRLPVVAMTQLLVAGDGFASVGLGYGTVDVPPFDAKILALSQRDATHAAGPVVAGTERAATNPLSYGFDYMVTGVFKLPLVNEVEIAALADVRPAPGLPGAIATSVEHDNRPVTVDGDVTQAVRVKWPLPAAQTSYGVVVSRKLNQVEVLNAPRIAGGGYDPFMPQRPPAVEGQPAPDDDVSFVDVIAPVDASSPATHRYAVAALDVFGRWSDFRMASRTVEPRPPQQPTVLRVDLLPNAPSTSSSVGGSIEILIGWNAEDRTAQAFELFGKFVVLSSASPAPEDSFTGGFHDGAAATTAVTARLAGTAAVGERSATIERIVQPDESATSPSQRWRVTVTDAVFNFSTASKLHFAVWARAYENVRPTLPSAVTRPRLGEVIDPRPPATPAVAPGIVWTALADATGRARGVLTLGPDRTDGGYVIWEATETAIRAAFGMADPAPGTALTTRAVELQTELSTRANAETLLSDVFSRRNTIPHKPGRIELDLPGSTDILYAYRVSAVNDRNTESSRTSAFVFLAVPARVVPGIPTLEAARVSVGAAHRIRVTAQPGRGAAPAGYRLFRARRAEVAADLGAMGPPIVRESNPAWATAGDGRSFEDAPSPSWKPFYYRAVGFLPDDASNGRYGGASVPSAAVRVLLPPPGAPTLTGIARVGNELKFQSSVPDFPTPAGTARIEVHHMQIAGQTRPKRVLLAAADPATIGLGAATATRFGKAISGSNVDWSLRIDAIAAGQTLVVVVTDPLGRVTEQTLTV